MKTERRQVILDLLNERNIFTQEELTAALNEAGFSVSQATVSRDIREMRLFKQPPTHKYVAPPNARANASPFLRVFHEGLLSVDYAENMLVLKTRSSMASVVAAALDEMDFSEVLGSVAGDDTVICVAKSKAAAKELVEKLR